MKSLIIFSLVCLSLVSAQWSCLAPVSNCASCGGSSFTVCTLCTTGFYLAPSQCLPCTPGCSSCQSNGACSTCQTGYGKNLSDWTCFACPSGLNCAGCTYSVDTFTNGLVPASTTYNTFFVNGPFQCSSCASGQYINWAGVCTVCPSVGYAGTCSITSYGLLSIAGGAAAGFYSCGSTAGVFSCSTCPATCKTCSGASTCTSCNNGFSLNSGACSACVANCASCADAGGVGVYDATLCDYGGTQSLMVNGTNQGSLNQGCSTGYVVTSAAASACVTSTATNCLWNYGLDHTGAYSAATCYVCNWGYVRAGDDTLTDYLCVACPATCPDPNTQCGISNDYTTGVCFSCYVNYTLVQTDATFTTGNYAPQGWSSSSQYSFGGNCIPLPPNCWNGQASTSSATVGTCTKCYPGFGLYWNSTAGALGCQNCTVWGSDANCTSCDFGVCKACNTSSYLAQSSCLQCPYNCSVCQNSTWCFDNCTKNYLYNAATGQCLPNGGSRIFLAGFALLSALLYFL